MKGEVEGEDTGSEKREKGGKDGDRESKCERESGVGRGVGAR